MKHLQDLKTPVNKFANTTRLIGLLLLVISTVGLVSYRSETEGLWDINNIFLAALFIIGAVATVIGELLWKMVLKNSDVTHRKFYFYDEE